MNLVFEPVLPLPLLILLAVALGVVTVYVYLRAGSRISRGRNAALLALRLSAITLIFFILLQPSRQEEIPRPGLSKVLLVALDTSRSMNQKDAGRGVSRLDAAKAQLMENRMLQKTVGREVPVRFFEFHEDAMALEPGSAMQLQAGGETTRIHGSVESILQTLGPDEGAEGLILLTDGHDFDMVAPARTGAMARARHVPIYPVPFGAAGAVRDASVRITSFQPYSYVRQETGIHASLRLIGCDFLPLTVQLLRQGELLQTKTLNADEHSEVSLEFVVNEEVSGQYEYEVRLLPLPDEIDTANNSANTFLNVINQKMRVLLLEGSPHWETTFLVRSLLRNEKVDLHGWIQHTPGAARSLRSEPAAEQVALPRTSAEFAAFDLILLGRRIDRILDATQVEHLEEHVREGGGAMIFFRGEAFSPESNLGKDLDPVVWDSGGHDRVRLEPSREGQQIPPTRLLLELGEGLRELPELSGVRRIRERKSLAAPLAEAVDVETGHRLPAIIHRPTGRGQVVSFAVEGLWRWAFHPQARPYGGTYDRFWDQTVLWLVASSENMPAQQFSFRASTANLLLGQKVHFRLGMRDASAAPDQLQLLLYRDDQRIGETALIRSQGGDPTRLSGEFVPDRTGRYRAVVHLPNAEEAEARFIALEENLEETEVAVDVNYLRILAETSGGRMLNPSELDSVLAPLDDEPVEQQPLVKRSSVWDHPLLFYVICALLGLDWYLRRKWGLA